MSQVNAANSLSQIMADIDLGPTGSIQFLFAKSRWRSLRFARVRLKAI